MESSRASSMRDLSATGIACSTVEAQLTHSERTPRPLASGFLSMQLPEQRALSLA
jgi:hypothetical protein